MAVLTIRKYPDPVLRTPAVPVDRVTKEIKKLIRDMMATMRAAKGIGLAAPQVGVSKRVIIVDGEGEPMAFINPEIVSQEGRVDSEEGCLSFPPEVRGIVPRAARVTVRALRPSGRLERIRADGLLSRVLQHEIDHLNGVLFVDRMTFSQKWKLREVMPV